MANLYRKYYTYKNNKFMENDKKKKAIEVIYRCYKVYKFKKLVPIFNKHMKIILINNCSNMKDSISLESFMKIPCERWVFCYSANKKKSWWFDIHSIVSLLGSSGSNSTKNPYTRKHFPPEFLIDVDEKFNTLKNKYDDLKELTQIKSAEYFSYDRYLIKIKSNLLFEHMYEIGYIFPRNMFIKFNMLELRQLSIKLVDSWRNDSKEDNLVNYPPNGEIFPSDYIENISSNSNVTIMKKTIVLSLLKSIVYNNNIALKTNNCIKLLFILGSLSLESHLILHLNNLCDCIIQFQVNTNISDINNIMNNLVENYTED